MVYEVRAEPVDSFSVGRVFNRAFAAIVADPGAAIGIALLFGAVPMIGYHYLEHSFPTTVAVGQPGLPPGFWLAFFMIPAIAVLSTVVNVIAEGAFVPLVVAQQAGRPTGFADAARAGLGALLPLILLGLVTGIGTMIASLFLIIPGIILMLAWSVAGPALVAERCGIRAALARSRALTSGARGGIFGLMLVIGAVSIAVSALVDQLATTYYGDVAFVHLFERGFPAAYVLAKLVTDTATLVFSAALYGALYVELRAWKEGAPVDALAEVFA
ncbi:hypothetical protein GCM10009087_03350 [Sphingomonas oligophenolica]|uniref:Glycerophosphoryl diester phosphodiesterase membrane domain-containing protein n=1 Tax=Sphingomonas oligophenolica TaxID=301154 RepID=A0ABU9Y0H0_9SPHN